MSFQLNVAAAWQPPAVIPPSDLTGLSGDGFAAMALNDFLHHGHTQTRARDITRGNSTEKSLKQTSLIQDSIDTMAAMSKAFTKESDDGNDCDDVDAPPLALGIKNYITPAGYQRLRHELLSLIDVERPKVVDAVHWAALNGDRSENGDYIYGKRRLREIDRRIRFLTKRLEIAEVADPALHHGNEQIFFGATVVYATQDGVERSITIKGVDEFDSLQGEVSWVSPIARVLLKARVGDEVQLTTPGGLEVLDILAVYYPPPAVHLKD